MAPLAGVLLYRGATLRRRPFEEHLAVFAPLHRAAAALALSLSLAVTGAARAQGDPYKSHMDNGVRLYSDHNYPAAVVEFQAAYEARPNANPLVNIALCNKEMFHYTQAITALVHAHAPSAVR